MIKNINQFHLITILFVIFFVINLNLSGFIFGHEGHAGPHLVGASINGFKNDFSFFFDDVFYNKEGIYEYSLYNHHPRLFFYIAGSIVKIIKDPQNIMIVLYSIAYIFNFIGIILIYFLTKKNSGNKKLSIFLTLSILGTFNVASFLNLATFDFFSIISATILYYYMVNFDREKTIKNCIYTIFILFFILNISWYNHLFFYVFILYKFIMSIFRNRLHSFFSIYKITPIFVSILITLILFYDIQNSKSLNLELIGDSSSKGFANRSIDGLSFYNSLKEILRYILKSSPFILLFFLLKNVKNFIVVKIETKYFDVLFSILISVIFFFALDIRWNLIHNFLALYIISFFCLLIPHFVKNMVVRNNYLIAQFILSAVVLSYYFSLDIYESKKTNYIFDYISKLDSENNEYFLYINNGTNVTDLKDAEIPKNFNKGRLFFLGSLPKIKGFSEIKIKDKTIIIDSDGKFRKY